jgi:hypothetical protein
MTCSIINPLSASKKSPQNFSMEYQETLHQTIFVNAKENLTKAHKLIVI